MREMGWGRNKTYNILKQLSEFGYINAMQERDPVSGAFGEVIYYFPIPMTINTPPLLLSSR